MLAVVVAVILGGAPPVLMGLQLRSVLKSGTCAEELLIVTNAFFGIGVIAVAAETMLHAWPALPLWSLAAYHGAFVLAGAGAWWIVTAQRSARQQRVHRLAVAGMVIAVVVAVPLLALADASPAAPAAGPVCVTFTPDVPMKDSAGNAIKFVVGCE